MGKERVRVPGEGVVLINGAVCDMERTLWDKAQCTRLHLEPSKMCNECLRRLLPGQQTLTDCVHEKNVCADGVLFTPSVDCWEIAFPASENVPSSPLRLCSFGFFLLSSHCRSAPLLRSRRMQL